MKASIKACVGLCLTLLMLGGCGSAGSAGSAATRSWTYMVYLGANNSLSDAGLKDLSEMETVGSNSDVAIAVQAEFSNTYTSSDATDTMRFLVSQDSDASTANLSAGTSIGNVDMGIPATLTEFINWAKTNYPAEHYALVIWDHGDGWKNSNLLTKGAVQDETSGSFMSLPDLATAVSDSGVHFDVINFDACLMSMYEVAYQFAGMADYLVGSEETEPGDGNPYDTILPTLVSTPTTTGRELAALTVDKYNEFYTSSGREATTLAAIDMSLVSTLDTKVRALAVALADDDTTNAVVSAAAANTQAYTSPENHDLYEVANYLATQLPAGTAKTAAQDLADFVPTMVVENKTTDTTMENSHGLAIYLPTVAQTNNTDLASYALLACNQTRTSGAGTWGGFVDDVIEEGGGATQQTATGNFGVRIDWDCDADVDLYIGEPNGGAAPGNTQAPWMGTTTPNGFFSQDSAVSGNNSESYQAGSSVESGDYYIMVNYYADGTSCTSTSVRLYILDPDSGVTEYTEVTAANGFTATVDSPRTMSLTNSWPGTSSGNPFDLNNYSDWWVPLSTTRAYGDIEYGAPDSFTDPGKRNEILFRIKKGSRYF